MPATAHRPEPFASQTSPVALDDLRTPAAGDALAGRS